MLANITQLKVRGDRQLDTIYEYWLSSVLTTVTIQVVVSPAIMVTSDWWVEEVNMTDVLKCAILTDGAPSAMISLDILMHKWLADN